eukprot:g82370.t1
MQILLDRSSNPHSHFFTSDNTSDTSKFPFLAFLLLFCEATTAQAYFPNIYIATVKTVSLSDEEPRCYSSKVQVHILSHCTLPFHTFRVSILNNVESL